MTGRRVHHHPRRFVDHHQVGILIDDLQRDQLGGSNRDVCLRDLVLDYVPFRDTIRGIGARTVDANDVALDEGRGRRAVQLELALRAETVQPGGGGLGDQAAVGLRNRYPTISRKTPRLTAESARLKTGQKWKLMKSVTPPPLRMRSKALPSAPPTINPKTASPLRSPGWRMTYTISPIETNSAATRTNPAPTGANPKSAPALRMLVMPTTWSIAETSVP